MMSMKRKGRKQEIREKSLVGRLKIDHDSGEVRGNEMIH